MALDLLAFGPHPDDLEIGLGGTIAKHAALGYSVGLCDLTDGELGSNGTVEERRTEALAAAAVLGAVWRERLGWPDGEIGPTPEMTRQAASLIRRHRPRSVAVPHWEDRHPDHVAASQVLRRAVFKAGLRRYDTGDDPWRPDWVCYYFINQHVTPSFVVDVSASYERKQAALDCYASQFRPEGDAAVATRLTAPAFRRLIESRDAQFGASIGCAFAEGLVVREPIVRSTVLAHVP